MHLLYWTFSFNSFNALVLVLESGVFLALRRGLHSFGFICHRGISQSLWSKKPQMALVTSTRITQRECLEIVIQWKSGSWLENSCHADVLPDCRPLMLLIAFNILGVLVPEIHTSLWNQIQVESQVFRAQIQVKCCVPWFQKVNFK